MASWISYSLFYNSCHCWLCVVSRLTLLSCLSYRTLRLLVLLPVWISPVARWFLVVLPMLRLPTSPAYSTPLTLLPPAWSYRSPGSTCHAALLVAGGARARCPRTTASRVHALGTLPACAFLLSRPWFASCLLSILLCRSGWTLSMALTACLGRIFAAHSCLALTLLPSCWWRAALHCHLYALSPWCLPMPVLACACSFEHGRQALLMTVRQHSLWDLSGLYRHAYTVSNMPFMCIVIPGHLTPGFHSLYLSYLSPPSLPQSGSSVSCILLSLSCLVLNTSILFTAFSWRSLSIPHSYNARLYISS